jgi:hypothetical protein
LSVEEKPGSTTPPPSGDGDRDKSTPSLEELDSAWSDEEYDEDATMVAKVPLDLVALSRRGTELEAKQAPAAAEPEKQKHEAITARPPPQPGEASVVVDVPHHSLPKVEDIFSEEEDEEDEEPELAADDLDAGWDIEEERAVAADVAAGLDPDARRKAAEARAALRREKGRAKKLAAKEKRKAHSDSIKQKQKKPKKRSIPPPPRDGATDRATPSNTGREPVRAQSVSREFPTVPPKGEARPLAPRGTSKRDLNRMVLFVALVVVLGALVIGLARR